MRLSAEFILLSPKLVILLGGLLLVGGCLSTPRDYSSPATNIRVVDQNNVPMTGIEVGRRWYDSDSLKEGSDVIATDQTGTSRFPKVPANVGLFTGAWRKSYSSLGMCGSGSGTSTSIYVRFTGDYDVVPKDKPLHKTKYGSYQDQDGVVFYTGFDSRSNMMVNLSFPASSKMIDYFLSAKPHGQ